jgi:hypothetical protein
MPDLSDEAWADIRAAAGRTPDAEARAALSAILFDDYPKFKYDRERVAAALRRSEHMLKHLEAFAAGYCDQFPNADEVTTERDHWCIEGLKRRTLAVLLAARVIRSANARRRNVQRELLYHWLCNVWIDHFHGELTYSIPSLGGLPRGPLIEFLLAAFRQIVSEDALPSREAVRDSVDRERIEREHVKQFVLKLRT